MKVDLVYKIGFRDAQDTNFELRHSIRSAIENFTDLGKIYIVGHKPDWCINVIHIPMGDPYRNNKDANLINKLLRACQEEGLSQEFLNMSDDYFFLEKISKDYFDVPVYDNEYFEKPNPEGRYTKWDRRLLSTKQILKERGYEQNIYDLHMPVLIDKTKYKEVMLNYDYGFDNGYCGNTLYFNTIGKKGREVVKNKTKEELQKTKDDKILKHYEDIKRNTIPLENIRDSFDNEELIEKKRQQIFQNSLNHFTETEEGINDEELRQKFPANIEGSKEFNEAHDSFDEIILEQEAHQYWEINEQIKKLEYERNEIIDNVQIQISRDRFDEINLQLVDLYEQRQQLELREKEFMTYLEYCEKFMYTPSPEGAIEYNKAKKAFEKSKLSNSETGAQDFEVSLNINNETIMKVFQKIKARRIEASFEEYRRLDNSRFPREHVEFTLINDEGQEMKVVKSLEELEEADREGITHVEERFREWLLSKDKENVDYQFFNDISRLTKPLKSVKEIQDFTANSLLSNYTAHTFNESMENFLALRFNKLCNFESK